MARDTIDRVWTALRIIGRGRAALDVPTLAMAAGTPVTSTADYLRLLVRAGYAIPAREGRIPTGERLRYRFVRDTGPKAPRRCITVMRDANTGEIHDLPRRSTPRPRMRTAPLGRVA